MLHFVEHGTGTPVLALHGWTPDHRLMLGCLEPVFAQRPGYRRLYPDFPGMGRSPAPESIASSDDVLAVVSDFVDETIGDEPFLLVGESYGGYIARGLVHARPSQVLGLALICPIGTEPVHARRTVPELRVLRPDPAVLASVDGPVAKDFAEMAVVQSPETLRRFTEEIMAGVQIADEQAVARIGERYPLTKDPDEAGFSYDRPTLILTGRQDNIVGYVDQFPLLARYPRASFAVLDVAGHNLHIEQPELFDTFMLDWLDRVNS